MKVLYITTIGGTMAFFKSFIEKLLEEGNIVDIATNECNGASCVLECYREWGCKVYPISCTRSPLKLGNARTIGEIRDIVRRGKYDIVHCHTPIAAACTRLACRNLRKNNNTKVLYTAHGFHFFRGAPLRNWIFFYPIEWLCSWWTDVLITITKEDYVRAKKTLHAKKTAYVPGVGVDTKKFAPNKVGREKIRKELGLKDEQTMILSVGELNDNKNHISVIRAIKNTDYVYVIVGKGDKKRDLEKAAKENNVDLRLIGYRKDVADIYNAADIYVLPSKREGLNVSLMEAMASGLPTACSDIRGNRDLVSSPVFNPTDVEGIYEAIKEALYNKEALGKRNIKRIRSFEFSKVDKLMGKIYGGMRELNI